MDRAVPSAAPRPSCSAAAPPPVAGTGPACESRRVPDDDATERLRRALYRPGATDDDVARWTGHRDTREDPRSEPAASSRRTLRRLVLPGAAVLGVVALVTVGSLAGGGAPAARSTPTAAAAPLAAATAPASAEVEWNGRRFAAREYRGTGDARFALDAPSATAGGGRVVVRLVAVDGERAGWRMLVVAPGMVPAARLFAEGRAADQEGAPGATMHYWSLPPSLMEVHAPTGGRWTMQVGFLPVPTMTGG